MASVKTKILSNEFHIDSYNQSAYLTRLVMVGEHKLRLCVRRNSYDFQSHALVDRWNTDRMAWSGVTSLPVVGLWPEPARKRYTFIEAGDFDLLVKAMIARAKLVLF